MYLQCISLSQPLSVLHWQLTPGYGFVQEGKNPTDAIRLSQRWWQYKQLDALTPPDAAVLGASSDNREVTVAALGAGDRDLGVAHLVNTGAARPVTITGVPAGLVKMRCHVTDATRGIKELQPVRISRGTARFTMPAQSFVSLTSE